MLGDCLSHVEQLISYYFNVALNRGGPFDASVPNPNREQYFVFREEEFATQYSEIWKLKIRSQLIGQGELLDHELIFYFVHLVPSEGEHPPEVDVGHV